MEQKLIVWVVKRNHEDANVLRKYLERKKDINKVWIFSKGEAVWKSLEKEKPDVLILDTDLEDMTGFELLSQIKQTEGIGFPFIMISSVSHIESIQNAAEYGASYYMLRPYNMESLYHRIVKCGNRKEYSPLISNASADRNNDFSQKKLSEKRNEEYEKLERQVTCLIRELGIPAHIKGYQYVRESVIMAVLDRNNLDYITKMLYPFVAKKYKTTSSSVERAIRHAIQIAFSRCQTETLEELFGYMVNARKLKPTNSEFIAVLADKMRLEYNARP